ncbi:hypothetical protein KCP75_13455 [Salmonella enterica subsp. enterica]|nr:hypothetical protein KCP75_13455 [Salmonella enterica subsp. enterica]
MLYKKPTWHLRKSALLSPCCSRIRRKTGQVPALSAGDIAPVLPYPEISAVALDVTWMTARDRFSRTRRR